MFSTFGNGETETLADGTSSAFAGAVLASNDPPEKIYAWYDAWLKKHGWYNDDNRFGGRVSTQTSLKGYSRGNKREGFYVAMNDPDSLQRTLGKTVPADKTVFEFQYRINPPKKK